MQAQQLKKAFVATSLQIPNSGFGQKPNTDDKQAYVFGSFEVNKHSVPDNFVIVTA